MMEKIKIILFVHNLTTIKEFAFEFLRRKECKIYWLTIEQNVINEIHALGYKEKVFFVDLNLFLFKNDLLKKIQNKIIYFLKATKFVQSYAVKRKYLQIKKEINPDIWISDMGIPLSKIKMNELKVNIFHSVCLKKFYLYDVFLNYDLLLLPNHVIKKRLIEYHQLPVNKQKGLKVVGWPRIDNLLINRANDEKHLKILLKEFNLDMNKKTLMYAPTWNSFNNGYIFPKSFGDCLTSFEKFCFEVSKFNINLIVKLHFAMWDLIHNKQLRKIAKENNILFLPKENVLHFTSNNEDYLKVTDVLVSDVSGIISDFLIFDRPIIYLEPDHPQFNWNDADYPPNFRAGLIANNFNKLIEYIKRSLDKPAEFHHKRKQIKDILFYKMDGKTTIRAVDEIFDYFRVCKFNRK